MCWSKGSEPVVRRNVGCPRVAVPCINITNAYCSGNGIPCCHVGRMPDCACKEGYGGNVCAYKTIESKGTLQRLQAIAAFSSIFGLMIIIFFVVVIVLQVKYYKNRRKRLRVDQEIKRSMRLKPEIRRKDDSRQRLLKTQPGYSWRQSVIRSTHNSRRIKGSISNSVPKDLYKIEAIMALLESKDSSQINAHSKVKAVDSSAISNSAAGESEKLISRQADGFQASAKLSAKKSVQFQTTEDSVHL